MEGVGALLALNDVDDAARPDGGHDLGEPVQEGLCPVRLFSQQPPVREPCRPGLIGPGLG